MHTNIVTAITLPIAINGMRFNQELSPALTCCMDILLAGGPSFKVSFSANMLALSSKFMKDNSVITMSRLFNRYSTFVLPI